MFVGQSFSTCDFGDMAFEPGSGSEELHRLVLTLFSRSVRSIMGCCFANILK